MHAEVAVEDARRCYRGITGPLGPLARDPGAKGPFAKNWNEKRRDPGLQAAQAGAYRWGFHRTLNPREIPIAGLGPAAKLPSVSPGDDLPSRLGPDQGVTEHSTQWIGSLLQNEMPRPGDRLGVGWKRCWINWPASTSRQPADANTEGSCPQCVRLSGSSGSQVARPPKGRHEAQNRKGAGRCFCCRVPRVMDCAGYRPHSRPNISRQCEPFGLDVSIIVDMGSGGPPIMPVQSANKRHFRWLQQGRLAAEQTTSLQTSSLGSFRFVKTGEASVEATFGDDGVFEAVCWRFVIRLGRCLSYLPAMRYPNQQGRGRDRAARDGLTVSETTTTAHRRAVPGFCKGLCAYLRALPAACGITGTGRRGRIENIPRRPTQPTSCFENGRLGVKQTGSHYLESYCSGQAGGDSIVADNQLGAARQLVEEGRSLNGREVKPSKRARKNGCHRAKTMEAHTHSAAPQLPSGFHFHGTIHAGANQWRWAVAVVGSPRPSVALSVIRQMNGGRRQDRLFSRFCCSDDEVTAESRNCGHPSQFARGSKRAHNGLIRLHTTDLSDAITKAGILYYMAHRQREPPSRTAKAAHPSGRARRGCGLSLAHTSPKHHQHHSHRLRRGWREGRRDAAPRRTSSDGGGDGGDIDCDKSQTRQRHKLRLTLRLRLGTSSSRTANHKTQSRGQAVCMQTHSLRTPGKRRLFDRETDHDSSHTPLLAASSLPASTYPSLFRRTEAKEL
ncbi:hypothetical protein K456DRAFT_1758597 [Colletotrichum gloeosporioides 23]|nr:hypothetical protein K456DRAFT_1758597 [Colletotrichum gloeosporioides 23]